MEPLDFVLPAAAYLIGSVPFAWLAVLLWKGVDIRTVGSGNVGATNAGRILGRRAAVGIYLLDAGKGAAAVFLARAFDPLIRQEVVCGLFAIIGHCFPVWLRFRGGKGVATTTGVFLALAPVAFLIAGAVWLAIAAVTRFVSMASIGLALAFPTAFLLLRGRNALEAELPILILAATAAFFIIIRHIPNMKRVRAGTEPRIGERK